MAPALHDALSTLAVLLGTWRGEGRGMYPTIEPFSYREEMTFEHVGDPFLLYGQESWSPEGDPVHFERGFLRPGADAGSLELCLAHPIGVTEVGHGSIDGAEIALVSDRIGRTATGMDVAGLIRHYRVDGDVLTYEIYMATDTTPMTRHLEARLRRVA